MTTSKTTTKLLTADDLLRLYSEGIGGELIRGVLVEKVSVSLLHGEIAMLLGSILISFIRPRGLGRIAGSDAGMMLERGPDTVREPDIAYISAEKLPLGVNIQGFYQGAPDLVVEIRSPSDSLTAVNDKAQMWLRFGVGLVWVVFPDSRTVEAHPASGPPVLLGEDDNLDGGMFSPDLPAPSRIYSRARPGCPLRPDGGTTRPKRHHIKETIPANWGGFGMMRGVGGRFRALDATLSATWFLLASPIMIHYVNAGPGMAMGWLERLPLLVALVCMAISVIFLVEFLLPSPLRRLIEAFRNSRGHRVSLLIGLVATFSVAWRTWVNDIFGFLGESGWLFDLVLYLGAFIWLVLAVQLLVAFVSRRSTIR